MNTQEKTIKEINILRKSLNNKFKDENIVSIDELIDISCKIDSLVLKYYSVSISSQ